MIFFRHPSPCLQPSHSIPLAAALAAGLLFTPAAGAQSLRMEGFSMAFNVNASNNSLALSLSDGVSSGSTSVSPHSNSLGMQLQYAVPVSDRTALTMGLSTVFGGLYIAYFNPNFAEDAEDAEDEAKETNEADKTEKPQELINIKDMTSLYLAPGFFANHQTFIYGKVAAVAAKSTLAGFHPIKGTAYGFGAQYFVSEKMFVQAELMRTTFDSVDHDYGRLLMTDKYIVNMLSVSMGYKF
jgi:opacity protein-like surface antigen